MTAQFMSSSAMIRFSIFVHYFKTNPKAIVEAVILSRSSLCRYMKMAVDIFHSVLLCEKIELCNTYRDIVIVNVTVVCKWRFIFELCAVIRLYTEWVNFTIMDLTLIPYHIPGSVKFLRQFLYILTNPAVIGTEPPKMHGTIITNSS
jgi:hypothetical protein